MIAEGAEFKVGKTYFKHIKGVLFKATVSCEEWYRAYSWMSEYKLSHMYVDLTRTETPPQQEFSSEQGDCIAHLVHLLCVELQLMYSYLPESQEFFVLYKDNTFKLTTSDDVGKLRHMISLTEELSCE